MIRLLTAAVAVVICAAAVRADEPQIGHMVFFQLKDNSPAARQKLVDACKKYLKEHDGVVYFSAGAIAEEFKRDVNDRDFDVALHLVFKNKASHDKYATAKTHLQFIEENKANWKKVRVFDSEIK
jgi:hypothetical protein